MALFSATATDARTTSASTPAVDAVTRVLGKLAFGVKVRSEFYTSMADFSDSGIPPYQALADMLVVAERRITQRSRVRVLRGIKSVVEEGRGLAMALAPWVPASEAVMLRGAETAGPNVLIETFKELGVLLGRQHEAKNKLVKALSVNVGLLALMVGVMYQVVSTLVPQLYASITPQLASTMPFAMGYFGLSQWTLDHGVALLFALGLFGAGVAALLPTWTGEWRRPFDLYVPPFSLYQKLQATLFLSSAASMMRAGITLNTILRDMGDFGSRWTRYHVRRMKDVLDSGAGEVKAIASGPLPNKASDALQVYQRIPKFQGVMTRLAEANFKAYEASIANISAWLTLFAMALMTAFGASTVVAMFQYSDAMQASAKVAQAALGG